MQHRLHHPLRHQAAFYFYCSTFFYTSCQLFDHWRSKEKSFQIRPAKSWAKTIRKVVSTFSFVARCTRYTNSLFRHTTCFWSNFLATFQLAPSATWRFFALQVWKTCWVRRAFYYKLAALLLERSPQILVFTSTALHTSMPLLGPASKARAALESSSLWSFKTNRAYYLLLAPSCLLWTHKTGFVKRSIVSSVRGFWQIVIQSVCQFR